MKYQLYPWQEKCLKQWRKKKYHGIVNVVTGGGKTYLALAAAKLLVDQLSISQLRIKIVVPTASLMTQWTSCILDFFSESISRRDIGLYYSGRKDTPDHPFMIYVINSARYSLARHVIQDFEEGFTVFFVADECHRYTGSENRKIFEFIPASSSCPQQYASLGLSATPELNRPENAAILIPALGREIFRYGFHEAEEEDTLCPYAAFHVALSFTPEEEMEYAALSDDIRRTFRTLMSRYPSLRGMSGSHFFSSLCEIAGDSGKYAYLARMYLNSSYKRKNLTSDAAARIQCVLKIIRLLDKRTRIIIFGERIQQADALYKKLGRLYPHQAVRFHSGIDPHARKLALERFHNGEARILISCRSLDEGFDVPSANVGIVMSSASVNRQRIQRLGRILRKHEGKDIASLYYLYIDESSEEATYFPSTALPDTICQLSYRWEDDAFCHPTYEEHARAAMDTFHKKNPDDVLLTEAKICFSQGIIRPDWLLGKAYCSQKIRTASTVEVRNYWICMKQIALSK